MEECQTPKTIAPFTGVKNAQNFWASQHFRTVELRCSEASWERRNQRSNSQHLLDYGKESSRCHHFAFINAYASLWLRVDRQIKLVQYLKEGIHHLTPASRGNSAGSGSNSRTRTRGTQTGLDRVRSIAVTFAELIGHPSFNPEAWEYREERWTGRNNKLTKTLLRECQEISLG